MYGCGIFANTIYYITPVSISSSEINLKANVTLDRIVNRIVSGIVRFSRYLTQYAMKENNYRLLAI